MPLVQSSDSPSSSKLSDSPELSTQPSRKRQRSHSMHSDSSASNSSVKRSVADSSSNEIQIRSPRTDQPSSLSLTDPNRDIDTYMAEQGEADITSFMEPPPSQISVTTSREEKVSLVNTGKGRRMEIGETWYLVSRTWYKRWLKACTGVIDKEGAVTEEELGPVNNTSILDGFNNLLPSLAEGVDVEYVPQEVWDLFIKWYDTPVHPLPRLVIARGASKLPALELRPLRLKVFRVVKSVSGFSNTSHPFLTISAGETVSKLCTELAKISSDGEPRTPYRIWRAGEGFEDERGIEVAASKVPSCDAKIVEEGDKTLEEAGIESDDAFIVEFKQPEGWIVEVPKSVQKSAVIEAPRPLFNSNEGFFNKMSTNFTPSTSTSVAITTSKNNFYGGLGSSSKLPSTSLTLTNKSTGKTLEPGTLGLGNMGNTCFMNSALQCLAHTKELTDYFLSGVYEDELNRDNPLGMSGAIAEAFGDLLQRIWATTGSSTSHSPREFKSQLQRFAPQFSGYQQHDSQELVAFLLDGLHEDLNRVIKKPYVEKPDWEGGGDIELVKLAQKSWEGYMLRNDSVIVDLFQGQYQSTLVCPECQKVSITFDPFMYLTLPLPIHKKWKHSIYYVPWDLEKPHVKVPVEINKDVSFKDLRALLGRWMGAPPENLLTLEIFTHRFYKNLDDNVPVGDMSDNDTIVCFELPCNARQSRTYKKQPDDPFIVPVYLCDAKAPIRSSYFSNSRGSAPNLFGYPMVIVIERDRATSVNRMYDIVATRLQRWTANSRDLYAWEAPGGSYASEIPIPINDVPPLDSITEITEDGVVVTVDIASQSESDIVDEKDMAVDEEMTGNDALEDLEPRKVGVKKDIFSLRLQVNHKDLGTACNAYTSNNRWESWDSRINEDDPDAVLLQDDDAFFCEFEEDKKAYYFGDSSKFEHALWDHWEIFTHPEYEESKKAGAEKRHKGISLQDCLDEFTKEEQLGEDDLWYCPQCKKHQQATKKFDLWKVPDILVVHLKRFSNNRSLRDKIDTHIDFPIEGLDLGDMVGERNIAQKLIEEGVNIEELQLGDLDEPLVYDLFGVDEHMGGLGGGHYRAYASNHLTGKWYHFDDSYVTPARASDSVNANAYLLFYRRRTHSPLGGKSFFKIQGVKSQPRSDITPNPAIAIGTQLPTPPNETDYLTSGERPSYFSEMSSGLALHSNDRWNLRSSGSTGGSSVPSPPTDDLNDFDDYQDESGVYKGDALEISARRYDFPDPSNKASPTSSNQADIDIDTDLDQDDQDWDASMDKYEVPVEGLISTGGEPRWDSVERRGSPSYSDLSEVDPFSDANVQKQSEDDSVDAKPSVNIKIA